LARRSVSFGPVIREFWSGDPRELTRPVERFSRMTGPELTDRAGAT
jgi:hypothetical protein